MFCPPEVGEILFETQLVTVKVLRKMNFEAGGIDLSRYKEGDKCRLPLWLARALDKGGFVEMIDDNLLTVTELSKALWKDQHSSTPLELPDDFYLKAKLTLSRLRESVRSFDTEKELSTLNMCFEDLVNVRLQKIFQAVRLRTDIPDFIKNLVLEERLLYRQLERVLSKWSKLIRGGL